MNLDPLGRYTSNRVEVSTDWLRRLRVANHTMKATYLLHLLVLPALIAVASCGSGDRNEPAQTNPNVIFILVDDMGWGDVGTFWQNQRKANNDRGEPWQLTPALDALSAGGAMLTHHYTAAPVCAPSRACCCSESAKAMPTSGTTSSTRSLKTTTLWGPS